MYVYLYVYSYTKIRSKICWRPKHIRTCTYVRIYTHVRVREHTYCILTGGHAYVYTFQKQQRKELAYLYMYIYIYMYTYAYIYNIHTYTHSTTHACTVGRQAFSRCRGACCHESTCNEFDQSGAFSRLLFTFYENACSVTYICIYTCIYTYIYIHIYI